MKKYGIGVIPGDGTGIEVTVEAMKALKTISEVGGPEFNLVHYDLGGERYLGKGELLPEWILQIFDY